MNGVYKVNMNCYIDRNKTCFDVIAAAISDFIIEQD